LLKELDYEKNADICTADEITAGSSFSIHWICSVCGYKWQAMPTAVFTMAPAVTNAMWQSAKSQG